MYHKKELLRGLWVNPKREPKACLQGSETKVYGAKQWVFRV